MQEKRAKKLQKQQIYKKVAELFGQFKKSSYLCTRKTGKRPVKHLKFNIAEWSSW